MADRRDGNTGGGQREWRQFDAISPLLSEGFSVIPNIVLRDREISGLAKAAYALIYDYLHRREPAAMDDLQADLGVGEKATRNALRELEARGFVQRRRHGQGRPNSYFLILPQEGSRTAPGQDPYAFKDVEEDADVEATASTSGRGRIRTSRKPDPVFDAVATATGANPAAGGGEIGKAASAIRAAERQAVEEHVRQALAAQPELDEIPKERIDAWLAAKVQARAARYRQMRPDWELTPSALAKHWLRIPTWEARSEQAWQRVLAKGALTARDKAALKAIGGSFTVRSSTHLPTTRRDFIAAWDDADEA